MVKAQGVTITSATTPMGEPTAHYWLVQRMAKVSGVDLVAAFEAGVLKQEDWCDIVTRCRSCQQAQGCKRWLDERTDDRFRPSPHCINQKRLAAVQEALERSRI